MAEGGRFTAWINPLAFLEVKVTTAIVRASRLIVVGNVSSTTLAHTRFATSTYDAAWGITRVLLQDQALRLGAQYVEVNESP